MLDSLAYPGPHKINGEGGREGGGGWRMVSWRLESVFTYLNYRLQSIIERPLVQVISTSDYNSQDHPPPPPLREDVGGCCDVICNVLMTLVVSS